MISAVAVAEMFIIGEKNRIIGIPIWDGSRLPILAGCASSDQRIVGSQLTVSSTSIFRCFASNHALEHQYLDLGLYR